MLANGNAAYLGGEKKVCIYIQAKWHIYWETFRFGWAYFPMSVFFFFFIGRDAVKKIALIRVWPFVRTLKSV